MKLYATTTSERASKGQGGNYVTIEITNEKKEVIAILSVVSSNYLPYINFKYDKGAFELPVYITDLKGQEIEKGEKKKGKLAI